MALTFASVAAVVNKPIYRPYMAGMQKSRAWSEQTNQIWTCYIPAYGTESCPQCPDVFFPLSVVPPTGNRKTWLAHETSVSPYPEVVSHLKYHNIAWFIEARSCIQEEGKGVSDHVSSHSPTEELGCDLPRWYKLAIPFCPMTPHDFVRLSASLCRFLAVSFGDRFCVSRKGRTRGGGWVYPQDATAWTCLCLAVERPWLAPGGRSLPSIQSPFFSYNRLAFPWSLDWKFKWRVWLESCICRSSFAEKPRNAVGGRRLA